MNEQDVFKLLRDNGFENARGEARMLSSKFSGAALQEALTQRLAHRPLQYILGEWGFYGELYEVNEHCLVPRSDTEILVEKAIAMLPSDARFLDLCTGSGCIAVSTLAHRKDASGIAVDLFEETLSLAKRNATKNGVADRVRFEKYDVLASDSLDSIASMMADGADFEGFDAILSNPPYIRNDVVPGLELEVQQEPAAALMGGEDGLDFYRAILRHWKRLLKKNGFLLLEIGYDQAEDIKKLAAENGFSATIWKDYGGCCRVAQLVSLART